MSISPAQRDEYWHKACIRHYASFYNTRRKVFDSNEEGYKLSLVDEMKENFSYVLGRQRNKDYAFMTSDPATNTQDDLGIVAGQKVAQLAEWMRGRFQELINNMKLTSVNLSPDSKSEATDMFDKLMIKHLLKDDLKEMEGNGVEFNPVTNFNPQVTEDIYKWMDRGFKSNFQVVSKDIADDILYSNYYKQLFLMCATHALAAGRTAIDCIVKNGEMFWQLVPAHQLILDTSIDDDFCKFMRFGGYIQYKTYAEIVSNPNYRFTQDEKDTLKALSSGQSIGPEGAQYNWHTLNTATSFEYFQASNNGQYLVAEIKLYWQSLEDAQYKQSTDRFGIKRMHPRMYKESYSDLPFQSFRQGVLIGNLVLKNYGRINNTWGALQGRPELDLPLKVFMPNMLMGENRSMVDRLKKHQDRVDAYRRKVTDLMSTHFGKTSILNAGAVNGTFNQTKVIADLKRDGVATVNLSQGEPGEGNQQNFVIPVDFTMDPNVKVYIDLMREEDRIMEEIANIPKIAQGLQSGYVGQGVQQRTLAQSSLGTATLYNGFVDWMTQIIQYSVNVRKLAMTAEKDNYEARLRIGDYGYTFARITKDIRMEEVGLYFKIEDVIDEAARGRIQSYAQAFSQNPESGIDEIDILEMERARTWSELIDNLKYSINRTRRERQQQKAYEDVLAQVMNERNNQNQAAMAQLQSIASQNNAQNKIYGDLLKEAIKQNPELVGGPAQQ